jgi:hypothetical protein
MNKLKPIILIAIFIGISSLPVLGQNTNGYILTKPYEKLTDDVLKNFKQDHDDLMAMQTSDRQLKTKLWLKLLNQIDKMRDGDYDFNDPKNGYSANVAIPVNPAIPNSYVYPAGGDPAYIKEPELREAYKEAIRKNHEKYLRANFELQLKGLDEDSTMLALRYFYSAYAKNPRDAKELIECLDILTDLNHKAKIEEQLHEFVELAKK